MTQILKIAIEIPLSRWFDYTNAGFHARVGNRVVVPFAGRNVIGVVVKIAEHSEVDLAKLKPVTHVFEDVVFDEASFALLQFCADYYHAPLGQLLLATLPLRLRQLKPAKTRKMFAYQLKAPLDLAQIPPRQIVLKRVAQALQNGTQTEAQLAQISAAWRKAMLQLEAEDKIEKTEVVAIKPSMQVPQQTPELNAEQTQAVAHIVQARAQFSPILLYGVTGSGKTEVYIQALVQILTQPNAQALVLVPEINLTPQLEARFRSRLSQFTLVTLHSNLSESERLHHWQAAVSGTARIVIGTRLSVFTPMPQLKLIIVDEEHDGSYKQQEGMRYHARDVAVMRAKQLNIPIVLGSATPALETWANAQKGQYQQLNLTNRAVENAQLPQIFCLDTAKQPTQNGLSPQLLQALKRRLAKSEQSLLFLNRRGFAPVLHCRACQWSAACTRCSARLVLHLSQKRLKCHHCGAEQKVPPACPSCQAPDLQPIGQATQRLEQTLAELLPNATIARVDRDSTRSKEALTRILNDFQMGKIDILVGTQMLAKGHDFPNLTLVGVLDTDNALFSPDFRAEERLFAQLMQVAGRAGRAGKAGEVLIQTGFPQHPLFTALQSQDYAPYAQSLLATRNAMQFPPVQFFALFKAEASDFALVSQWLNELVQLAKAILAAEKIAVQIYDPVRPQMERLKSMERGQVLLQAKTRGALQSLLKKLVPQMRAEKMSSKIRWALDIDPLEF